MSPRVIAHTACAAALLSCAGALAHHSYAMFDANKTVTLEGTLYAAQFVNPHGWIWIEVINAKGESEKWGLEGGSTADFRRKGYTRQNLVVGTKVQATMHPLKDGSTGGQLVALILPDAPAAP